MTTDRELSLMIGLQQGTTDRIVRLLADGPKSLVEIIAGGVSAKQAERGLALLRFRGEVIGEPAGDPRSVVWTVYRLKEVES